MATLARTYRLYLNDDGSLNINRASVRGKNITGESSVTKLNAGWTNEQLGEAIEADHAASPIAAGNSDTEI